MIWLGRVDEGYAKAARGKHNTFPDLACYIFFKNPGLMILIINKISDISLAVRICGQLKQGLNLDGREGMHGWAT